MNKTKKARSYEINMTEGPLLGKMILFAIPLILSGMLQLLFNTVDTIVVGKFVDDTALAAVGSTGALVNLIVGLFMGLSVGTNVLVARGYGAGREQDVQKVISTSVIISIVFGVILGAFGAVFAGTFLRWMDTPVEVHRQATIYLVIFFIGMPFNMLYNFSSAVLRAVGDTRRPLYYLIIAGVVNVILNLFCVIVLKIGVAGVAIATIISQAISAILVVITLMKTEGMIHLDLRHMKFDGKVMLQILSIGLPAGVQSIVFSVSNVMIQSSINSFGPLAMAGNTAACNLESFVGNCNSSMHQANINFTSQNVGAGKYNRVYKVMGLSMLLAFVMSVVMSQCMYRFGYSLLKLYTNSDDVIKFGLVRLRVVTQLQFMAGLMDTMVGSLRGIGASITPTIVSITGVCAFRVVYIQTYFRAHHSLDVLYASYPITWLITLIGHVICFFIIFDKVKKRAGVK